MSEHNKRQHARFPVQQNLVAAINGHELVGACRDVNAEGVFFFTSTPVAEGDHVEIHLNLPAGIIFSDAVSLRASGKAIRVEQNSADEGCGAAVAFERIEIHHSTGTGAGSD